MVWDGSTQGGFTDGKPWLPVKAPQLARNVASQGEGSILDHYRRMLAFRRATPALTAGRTHFFDVAEPILAFTRHIGDETLLCVYNLSPEGRALDLAGASALLRQSLACEVRDTGLWLGPNAAAFLPVADVGRLRVG